MKPLYIFDLDGTLADASHRQPILDHTDDPERWNKFYDACDKDSPIHPVIDVLIALQNSRAEIWIFSGRSDRVRSLTAVWLGALGIGYDYLQMRGEYDYTVDHELKESWLKSMLDIDRQRLVAVFDDRQQVVDMWRRNGVTCFQVAPGDF
jgi:FMN phosphatase YigB (HAD superfamily)